MWNPIRVILTSQSPRGIKIIALSLLLVLASAMPIMLYSIFGPDDGGPIIFGWLFAAGAVLAHIGFLVGILLVLWDMYKSKQ